MGVKLTSFKGKIISLSLLVFAISLTQQAFTVKGPKGDIANSSISVFLIGSTAILGGGTFEEIVWLANPLYFAAMLFYFKRKKDALGLSMAAVILAGSFSFWQNILTSESGSTGPISHLKFGYWLWVIALIILAAGILYDNLVSPRKDPV